MNTSLYIHIPFCKKKCDYCDFFSIGEADRLGKCNDLSDSYISALVKEIKLYADFYKVTQWKTIYVGGGTPSLLSPGQIKHLFSLIKEGAPLSDDAEITFEMNPDDVNETFLQACSEAGINRLSMGIQALDNKALAGVNRGSSVLIIQKALNNLKKFWKGRLSVDFIAGLPFHTFKSFQEQFALLDENENIDHVSLYTLTVEENTPLGKKIDKGIIHFSYDKADKMWMEGRKILEEKGFRHYEVSNFTKENCESHHNLVYWNQESYIGIGSGASGTYYDFSDGKAIRWTNSLSIPAYIAGVEKAVDNLGNLSFLKRNIEVIDLETLEFEFLMLGFRKLSGVNDRDFEKRFNKSLEKKLGADCQDGLFSKWEKKSLSLRKKNPDGSVNYSLSSRGILLLNRFLEELL